METAFLQDLHRKKYIVFSMYMYTHMHARTHTNTHTHALSKSEIGQWRRSVISVTVYAA